MQNNSDIIFQMEMDLLIMDRKSEKIDSITYMRESDRILYEYNLRTLKLLFPDSK